MKKMNNSNHYEERAMFLKLWLIRSNELNMAAEALWNSVTEWLDNDGAVLEIERPLYRPALLLMGLSLEVLIKGFLIQQDGFLTHQDYMELASGKFPVSLTKHKHKLLNLFKLADIEVEAHETDLLERLTDSVGWLSKYAVPLEKEALNSAKMYRRDFDLETYQILRKKILTKFKHSGSSR